MGSDADADIHDEHTCNTPDCSCFRCFLCAGCAEGACSGSSSGASNSSLLVSKAFSLPGWALISFLGLQAGDAAAAEAGTAACCFNLVRSVRFKAWAVPTCCLRTATRSYRCSCGSCTVLVLSGRHLQMCADAHSQQTFITFAL